MRISSSVATRSSGMAFLFFAKAIGASESSSTSQADLSRSLERVCIAEQKSHSVISLRRVSAALTAQRCDGKMVVASKGSG